MTRYEHITLTPAVLADFLVKYEEKLCVNEFPFCENKLCCNCISEKDATGCSDRIVEWLNEEVKDIKKAKVKRNRKSIRNY